MCEIPPLGDQHFSFIIKTIVNETFCLANTRYRREHCHHVSERVRELDTCSTLSVKYCKELLLLGLLGMHAN